MSTIINPDDDTCYFVSPLGITISGYTKQYKTYEDMINESNPPTYAIVVDATADPTVGIGGAIYRYDNGNWTKVYETESLDQDLQVSWNDITDKPLSSVDAIDNAVDIALNQAITDVSDITNKLTVVETTVANSTTRLTSLESITTEHTSQIQTILNTPEQEIYVTSVNNRIGDIVITLDELGGATINSVAALNTAITTLTGTTQLHTEQIATLLETASGVSSVNGRVGDVVITLNELNGVSTDTLSAVQDEITTLESTVNANAVSIGELETTTSQQQSDTTVLSGTVEQQALIINSLSDTVEQQAQTLGETTDTVNDHTIELEDLAVKIDNIDLSAAALPEPVEGDLTPSVVWAKRSYYGNDENYKVLFDFEQAADLGYLDNTALGRNSVNYSITHTGCSVIDTMQYFGEKCLYVNPSANGCRGLWIGLRTNVRNLPSSSIGFFLKLADSSNGIQGILSSSSYQDYIYALNGGIYRRMNGTRLGDADDEWHYYQVARIVNPTSNADYVTYVFIDGVLCGTNTHYTGGNDYMSFYGTGFGLGAYRGGDYYGDHGVATESYIDNVVLKFLSDEDITQIESVAELGGTMPVPERPSGYEISYYGSNYTEETVPSSIIAMSETGIVKVGLDTLKAEFGTVSDAEFSTLSTRVDSIESYLQDCDTVLSDIDAIVGQEVTT